MNKAELIDSIAKLGKYGTKADASRAYDYVAAALVDRLSKGKDKERVIRLPELGTFQMKIRKARTGRNPQTGKSIKISAKKTVTFRAGKSLKDSL
ncbi:MAG: HU family DNA-binding protein [Candidatus Omnitrophica bacterium]|nr:HU family DNA-binding protein [Candidatus Omnitrophota bacterium]